MFLNQFCVVTCALFLFFHFKLSNSIRYSYLPGTYGYRFQLNENGRAVRQGQHLPSPSQPRYMSLYQLYHPKPNFKPQIHYSSIDHSELETKLAPSTTPRDKYQKQRQPKRVCKEEGVQPHPTECSKFIRCKFNPDESLFYYEERICPDGLAFDSNLESCNYQEKVPNCGSEKNRAQTTPTSAAPVPCNHSNVVPPQYISPQFLSSSPSPSLPASSTSSLPSIQEGGYIGTKSPGKPIYTRYYPKISSKPSTRREDSEDHSQPKIFQMELPKYYSNSNSDDESANEKYNLFNRFNSTKTYRTPSTTTKLDKHKRINKMKENSKTMVDLVEVKTLGNGQKRRKPGRPNNKLEDSFIEPAASSINMAIIQTTRKPSINSKSYQKGIGTEDNGINLTESVVNYEELEERNDY